MHSRPTFDEVYERYLPFVWRVLRTLELPSWAIDDGVQEVFVVVHRRLCEFEGRSDIRTWLFRVATWVAANERRRVKANAPHDSVDEGIPDEADGPFEVAVRSETIRTLERVLDRMDSEKRMILVLMDIEEMKATEVAELFDVNVNTVYSRLRLAREQFRRLFEVRAPAAEEGKP